MKKDVFISTSRIFTYSYYMKMIKILIKALMFYGLQRDLTPSVDKEAEDKIERQ